MFFLMFLLQLSVYQPINAHLYVVVMDAEFDNLPIGRPVYHTGQIGSERELTSPLTGRGIDFHTLAVQAGKPNADPFDLLCNRCFMRPDERQLPFAPTQRFQFTRKSLTLFAL